MERRGRNEWGEESEEEMGHTYYYIPIAGGTSLNRNLVSIKTLPLEYSKM